MENIILKQKQASILLALRDTGQNWYISSLAKATSTTYVHTCNFLVICERLGITTNERHGKLKLIKLTEKGLRLADMLQSINTTFLQEQQKQPEPSKQQPGDKPA
jgi:hypothetical protein